MAKRSPMAADAAVGENIRTARIAAGLSQTDLGRACGISFQQIQKYEKGTNRVGGSRLMQIAEALKLLDLSQDVGLQEAIKPARERAETSMLDDHGVVEWPFLERPAVFIPQVAGMDLVKEAHCSARAQLLDYRAHDAVDFSAREVLSLQPPV